MAVASLQSKIAIERSRTEAAPHGAEMHRELHHEVQYEIDSGVFASLLAESRTLHDHLCPRQVLGVRMGMLAGEILGLALPQTNKRLLTFVETDGCFSDGIAVATGCTMGHRTMRLVDHGKVAATCVDTRTDAAWRIHPHPLARSGAASHAPEATNRWQTMLLGYQRMPVAELLVWRPVTLTVPVAEIVSRAGLRTRCERCGEEIINRREVVTDDVTLCRACAGDAYFAPVRD